MTEIMVSIRMPESLVNELKLSVKEGHFLDLSEEIRSIIRKKWIESQNPELFELKKLSENIREEIKRKTTLKVKDEVNKELEKIRNQLKGEEILR